MAGQNPNSFEIGGKNGIIFVLIDMRPAWFDYS